MDDVSLEHVSLLWLHPETRERVGRVRHVLFDFDGTISTLRQGWEDVMVPVMIEAICGKTQPTLEIVKEVREYVDRSTGILTIRQMEWLAEAVARHGLAGAPLPPAEYKAIFLQGLMVTVRQRTQQLAKKLATPADYTIGGAADFVRGLAERGVQLYLASGSDHDAVVRETGALGLMPYFEDRIYGALDTSEEHAKDRVIQHILDTYGLHGDELLVVGDGPVEIREAVARQAIAMGVASDEVARQGWNIHKIKRLATAGSDLLIPDFRLAAGLVDMLAGGSYSN